MNGIASFLFGLWISKRNQLQKKSLFAINYAFLSCLDFGWLFVITHIDFLMWIYDIVLSSKSLMCVVGKTKMHKHDVKFSTSNCKLRIIVIIIIFFFAQGRACIKYLMTNNTR